MPSQQEMAQVDRPDRVSSPFWRSKASAAPQQDGKQKRDLSVPIGASYSHADLLRMEAMSLTRSASSKSPRQQTPPPSSSERTSLPNRSSPGPLLKGLTSPSRNPSKLAPSQSIGSRDRQIDEEEDDESEPDQGDVFGAGEDEFGLPSIPSHRKKSRRKVKKGPWPGGGLVPQLGEHNTMNAPPVMSYHSRRHISTDISEERNLPVYPTIERSEGKILRPRYKDLLQDPASMLYLIQHPPTPLGLSSKQLDEHNVRLGRIAKFKKVLQATDVNLGELRDLAWSGIPGELRAFSWQLLLGYLPTLSAQRVPSMEGKRREYLESMKAAFKTTDPAPNGSTGRPLDPDRGRDLDEAVWHQIEIDIPRTNPHLPLYQYEATQRSLERVLYTWAVRHPASGYVQGMNDLITPFWQVFLGTYITDSDIESGMDPGQLPKSVLDAVEADTYWCLTKLLDGIQDNYIYAQPGIQRQVAALRDLTARIDLGLARHLEREGVEFIQFSFRWINCLLMREVSIDNVIRMWDTYLAEEQGFSGFHLYVCAAFLVRWSAQLVTMDFQEIMMFLQALPTRDWTEKEVELLLSEAYIWQSLFRGSSAHLRGSSNGAPIV